MFLLDDFHQSVRIFSLKLLVRVIFLNICALMLENASLFGWGLVSKQIQENFSANSFMPMCTKYRYDSFAVGFGKTELPRFGFGFHQ